jgi:hypothetical protein
MPKASATKTIWCCACDADIEAIHRTGAEIYPRRPDLAHKRFWQCVACANYVGCHGGGYKPLGNIPTPALRQARGHIHALLDPIWKSGRMARSEIYRRISEKIGREYHTGEIKTLDDARAVYRIVKDIARA